MKLTRLEVMNATLTDKQEKAVKDICGIFNGMTEDEIDLIEAKVDIIVEKGFSSQKLSLSDEDILL